MTTLLPPQEVDALRSLKATAFLLAVMIKLDQYHPGQAFRPEQIAPIVEMDTRTVTKHLQSLSARNRVLLTRTGYVLTEGGRAMFLAAPQNEPALSPGSCQALSPAIQTGTGVRESFSPGEDQAQNAKNLVPDTADSTHNVCALGGEEEIELNLKKDIDSSSDSSSAQIVLNTRVILAQTKLLFEKAVFEPADIDQIDPDLALAWVAHGYDQRQTSQNPHGLFAPWGLIYRSLCQRKEPRAAYLLNPEYYLPANYLLAIGMPVEEAIQEIEAVSVETARPASGYGGDLHEWYPQKRIKGGEG